MAQKTQNGITFNNYKTGGVEKEYWPLILTNQQGPDEDGGIINVVDVLTDAKDVTLKGPTTYYWYVGTTKPTALSQASTVTSYPAEQIFTNPSTTEKCYVYVLTNADKTVNMYDPADPADALLKAEDTSTINGYKITYLSADGSTPFKIAKGGSVIIKVS